MTGRGARWALVAVLLLAFALRLYRLGAGSLWYDETVSLHLAGKAPPALLAHTAGDIHPPGYYLLLHGWLALSGSGTATGRYAAGASLPASPVLAVDFVAAFLSLFFGLLLVALAHRLAAEVFGPLAGLLAAFLVAISPYNVWYSQEVRMYTLAAVLATGMLLATIRLLRLPPAQPKTEPPGRGARDWPWLGLYALLGALGLWTLYYLAFLLAAINLMVGAWWLARQRTGLARAPGFAWRPGLAWLGRWLLAQVAVLLLYSPWIPVAWRQATEPPVPPWRSFTGLGKMLVETWTALSLGQSAMPTPGWPPVRLWPVLLLVAGLVLLGLFARRRRAGPPGRAIGSVPLFLAGHAFLPVLLIYLASLVTPLYHVRYAFPYSTPLYVLLAGGLAWLWQRWRPVLAWLALGILVVFAASSLYAYHTDPHFAADDHRAAVAFLSERWRPGDAILVNAGYAYPALLHYWNGEPIVWRGRLTGEGSAGLDTYAGPGPVIVQAGTVDGAPSLGWGDPDSDFYAMGREETAQALERLFAAHDRIWVYRIYDTVTDPEGFVRDWLAAHGRPLEDQVFTGESQLRVQGFLAGRDPLAGTAVHHAAGLADGSLELLASDLDAGDPATAVAARVQVGGALDLALVWRAGSSSQVAGLEDAVLFAGLFDGTGRRWAQADVRPLGPLFPVNAWPAGTLARTPVRVRVPAGTPPATYRLEVGWYRFEDGQPVWLPWPSGIRFLLGDVQVVPPTGGWERLPGPAMAYTADVTVGDGVRFLGFDAPSLSARPGQALDLDLYWKAMVGEPPPGVAVLQLISPAGQVVAEVAGAPAGGLAPFAGLEAGQIVRDPRQVSLPRELLPGVYDLSLGRRGLDGAWLPVGRGPFSLGQTYPLATVEVLGD